MKLCTRKPPRFIRDALRASSWNQGRLAASTFVVVLFGGSSLARAETNRERFSLEYQVVDTCPNRERFVSEVASLTDKADFAHEGDAPLDRELHVTIAPGKSGFSGTMSLKDESGTSLREIDGETCEEVALALALALALAVDPEALSGASERSPDPEPVILQETPSEESPETAGNDNESSKSQGEARSESNTHLIIGAAFQYGFWLVQTQDDSGSLVRGSHSRLQGSASLELETKALGFWTSYILAIGGAWAQTEPLSFRWLPSVRASVCPLLLRGNDWLRFGACVGGIFAPVHSPPGEFEQAQGVTINYAGIDSVLRLQFVAGAIRAELQGGVELPLVTRSYATASADGSDNIVLAMDYTPTPTLGLAVGWQIF
jgi:hypothetical protein